MAQEAASGTTGVITPSCGRDKIGFGFARQLPQAQGGIGAELASLGGAFWELASAAVVDDLFAEGLDVGCGFGDGVVLGVISKDWPRRRK